MVMEVVLVMQQWLWIGCGYEGGSEVVGMDVTSEM